MPHKFAKCVDAALSPRRHIRVHILNYLDDWLILAQSEHELIVHWYVSRRVETLHPGDLERAEVDLFTSEDNSHCPIFFSKDSLKGTSSRVAQLAPVCLSPNLSAPLRHQTSQGIQMLSSYGGSPSRGFPR